VTVTASETRDAVPVSERNRDSSSVEKELDASESDRALASCFQVPRALTRGRVPARERPRIKNQLTQTQSSLPRVEVASVPAAGLNQAGLASRPYRTACRARIVGLRRARTPARLLGRPARSSAFASSCKSGCKRRGPGLPTVCRQRCDRCRVKDGGSEIRQAASVTRRIEFVTPPPRTETPRSTRLTRVIAAIANLRRSQKKAKPGTRATAGRPGFVRVRKPV